MNPLNDSFTVVDSHIHLYAASQLRDLAWAGDLPPDHVLKRQNSVEQYKSASRKCPTLYGFVFVETDRISGLNEAAWQKALEEIEFLSRIRRGLPFPEEGHSEEDGELVLGIVPWAPVPAGADAVKRYLEAARRAAGTDDIWSCIRGFRYLVQDKPRGTMLQSRFIEGLIALESSGTTSFDLGVDTRQGGHWQLHEACLMLDQFYRQGQSTMNIMVNHLCKPNLQLSAEDCGNRHPEFEGWKQCILNLAAFPTTYMKLSGLLSELPDQDEAEPQSVLEIVRTIRPWTDVVFQAFGPSRIMFGSDWPVCNAAGPGLLKSWQQWYDVVSHLLDVSRLTAEERAEIWSGTAVKAYGLHVAGNGHLQP